MRFNGVHQRMAKTSKETEINTGHKIDKTKQKHECSSTINLSLFGTQEK